ncbi:MAG: hypothetical protein AB1704_20695 [Pseudomonadota bacterium]
MSTAKTITEISSSVMLCNLSVSAWKARKFDGKVTAEVEEQHQVEDAGRYNKRLLMRTALSYNEVTRIEGEMRRYWESHTLDYKQKSIRILPTAMYMDFVQDMRRLRERFEMAVSLFLSDYPNLKEAARVSQSLGPLYREEDYPTQAQLQEKFRVSLTILPFPNASQFGVDLPADMLTSLKSDLDKHVEYSIKTANRDLVGRLYEAVSKLAATLYLNDSPRLDVANNVKSLCELLPKLNFSNDPDLNRILDEAKLHLGGLSGADLKQSAFARATAAAKASELESMMAAFMGGAPAVPASVTAVEAAKANTTQLRLVA